MGITHQAALAVGHALRNVHAGARKLASRKLTNGAAPSLEVESPLFQGDGALPLSSTLDGARLPPPLAWSEVPPGTKSVAVIVEDPDAPFPEPFVHWLVYDLPAAVPQLACRSADELRGYTHGRNSKLARGFTPAAPPPGHGRHRYHFQVFALDTSIDAPEGLGRRALLRRMRGHVLAWGEMVGTHERP